MMVEAEILKPFPSIADRGKTIGIAGAFDLILSDYSLPTFTLT